MLMPAVVCLTSLLENAAPTTFYDIIVLHSAAYDFSASALSILPQRYPNCRISFRKVGDDFTGAYEVRGISIETYYRLLAPELIPEYDKILYSDVDVIFREDLSKFYDMELGDHLFAGVDNGSALRPEVQKHVTGLGLDYSKGYFYAGNIIMNLAQMREEHTLDIFKELGKKEFPQQDMDILNIAATDGSCRLALPSACRYCSIGLLSTGGKKWNRSMEPKN